MSMPIIYELDDPPESRSPADNLGGKPWETSAPITTAAPS